MSGTQWGTSLSEMGLADDVGDAVRAATRHSAATAAIVLSLALGVGPNVVMFSAADAVLLRPLPFRDPDRLVVVHGVAGRNAVQLVGRAHSVEDVASYRAGFAEVSGGDAPAVTRIAEVTASFFPLLGVSPQLGRFLIQDDERPAAPRVAIISSGLWWRCYGGDPSVLERPISLAGQSHAVVGVAPPDFAFPDAAEVWVAASPGHTFAFSAAPDQETKTRMGAMGLLVRLRKDVTLENARTEVVALHRQQQEDARRTRPELAVGTPVYVRDLHETMVGQAKSSLILLLGGTGFVLLIALANAAHLLLERSEARRRDVAIRVALGAGPHRVLRQLLAENLLYGLLATALSLSLAHWGLALVGASLDSLTPAGIPLRIDGRTFAFAAAASIAVTLLAGIAPASRFVGPLADKSLRVEPLRGHLIVHDRLRGVLVVSELAAAVVLLAGAGLLLKGLALKTTQTRAALGFRTRGVLTFEVAPPVGAYSPSLAQQLRTRILDRLRSIPGVESAAATDALPYGLQRFLWFDVE